MSVALSISPTASPARVAANRRNAQQSSGPKTPEGKARSRANAVKHGLTGAGIALPTEDAAAVAGRFDALQVEMGPSTVLGAILVKQVALMSVRLDRAALQESAALASRVRHAISDFDNSQIAETDALVAGLEAGRSESYHALLAIPAGVDRLIEGLIRLREGALLRDPQVWTAAVGPRLEAYLGHGAHESPRPRTVGLFAATVGDFRFLDPSELNHLDGRGTWLRWAQHELVAAIGAEVARLTALRADLDEPDLVLDRSEAQTRALFDPGPEATRARKYEAEARRGLFRALREFRLAEADPNNALPDDSAPTEPPEPAVAPDLESASYQNEPKLPPVGRASTPSTVPSTHPNPLERPIPLASDSPKPPLVGDFWPRSMV